MGQYVQLRPAGNDSLKGLSPFKDERTPSFYVRPLHGYYHCFSTDQGGDVFAFLMAVEHLSFKEAVEYCAEKIGYHINYEQSGQVEKEAGEQFSRKRLLAANAAAFQFYRRQLELPEAQPGRDFLTGRGFSAEDAHLFGCGYAPAGWDALTQTLIKQGFTAEELVTAGLATQGKRGLIDRFHRRLLWPIKSQTGDVIGFGARKLFDDDQLGKYMNTPETPLYKKSKVLFGLDLAKKAIASGRQAVVVEGYTDVMAMHAAGVTSAVAACGTAFGEEHLQILRRLMLDDSYLRGEIIYTFDGDEAGQKAAQRAFTSTQHFMGQSFVAVAPDGLDPCDLRMQRGDAAVRHLVANRMPMVEFMLRNLIADYDLATPEGRLQALERAVPLVAGLQNNALQREYTRQLAGWIGWANEGEVTEMVKKEASKLRSQRHLRLVEPEPAPAQQPAIPLPRANSAGLWPERESLKIALQYPQVAGAYFDGLGVDIFTQPAYKAIAEAIAAAGGCAVAHTGGSWIATVQALLPDFGLQGLLSELAVENINVDVQDINPHAEAVFAHLQAARVTDQIAQLKAQMQRLRPEDGNTNYQSLFADLIALEAHRKELLALAMTLDVPMH